MPKQISETEAMKVVEDALAGQDEEARARIMNWIASKYKLSVGSGHSAGARQDFPGMSRPSEEMAGVKNIRTFLASKKPTNSYEQVACLAYWMERNDKKDELTIADFHQAKKDARVVGLSNVPRSVRHAKSTYGFLTSLGRGKYGISPRGEAVVEALPNREMVTAALAEHKVSRKSKRKRVVGKK
jgi:hypothetical protein